MKKLIPVLLLVAVFITASFLWEGHVRNHTSKLLDTVNSAMDSLDKAEDYAACSSLLDDFQKQWEHVHDSWETLIAHKRLTEIDASLVQAQWAVSNQDKEEALIYLSVLRLDLEHLSDYYSVSLSNLL